MSSPTASPSPRCQIQIPHDPMPPRRRYPASPPATPPDNEDLVAEFLLRLPPRPSSLPRAAAVCKAWRRVVNDPHFLRRFHAHHRKPPVLGFFDQDGTFFPTLEAPYGVSSARLSFRTAGWKVVACRDGLVLCRKGLKSLRVLDPWAGDWSAVLTREDKLPKPLNVELVVDSTGVERSFRLFALSTCADWTKLSVSVYSSDSGVWAHSVETLVSCSTYLFEDCHGSLVGNVFYWIHSDRILQYNLETQTLAIIDVPWNEEEEAQEEDKEELGFLSSCRFVVMAKDGFLCIKATYDHIWVCETVLSSAENWVPHKTVLLDTVLPLELKSLWWAFDSPKFVKENNVIFLSTRYGIFMINLESKKFTNVYEGTDIRDIHPYSSFVTADGHDTI